MQWKPLPIVRDKEDSCLETVFVWDAGGKKATMLVCESSELEVYIEFDGKWSRVELPGE